MQCLEGCEEIMINTGQMAPWSRPHFNFLPAEIWCHIFSTYPPYSTVLMNLIVTQLAKKYISLMEFKHPQHCCQGPAAEFNPQSVYILTFLILLSHLNLVTVFNNKKLKKKQRHAKWIHNWVHRNVSLALRRKLGKPVTIFIHISKSKTEPLNPFSYVDGVSVHIYSQVC